MIFILVFITLIVFMLIVFMTVGWILTDSVAHIDASPRIQVIWWLIGAGGLFWAWFGYIDALQVVYTVG